jgi:hypothetical protein
MLMVVAGAALVLVVAVVVVVAVAVAVIVERKPFYPIRPNMLAIDFGLNTLPRSLT